MAPHRERVGTAWSEDELLLALNLYFRLPFGRINQRNPEVVQLASAIGRSPASVSLRLANYASLDPSLRQRGVRGMANSGRKVREIWERFAENREDVAFESEILRSRVIPGAEPMIGIERDTTARTRVNQGFFRRMMLARYGGRCSVTGLTIPGLIVASHIVRWADEPSERLNPANGLLLNPLHDRAFEIGVMTISDDLRIKIDEAQVPQDDDAAAELLTRFHDRTLLLPSGIRPSRELLARHRERIGAE